MEMSFRVSGPIIVGKDPSKGYFIHGHLANPGPMPWHQAPGWSELGS